MGDPEIRAMDDKTITAKWMNKEFKIAPKPMSQIDQVAKEMDKFVTDGTDGIGRKDFFTQMFATRRQEVIDRLRFFIVMPEDVTDEWLIENLTIPRLVWFDELIAEVNQLDYIANFLGLPGLQATKKAPAK